MVKMEIGCQTLINKKTETLYLNKDSIQPVELQMLKVYAEHYAEKQETGWKG